jgi:hypothetical protein
MDNAAIADIEMLIRAAAPAAEDAAVAFDTFKSRADQVDAQATQVFTELSALMGRAASGELQQAEVEAMRLRAAMAAASLAALHSEFIASVATSIRAIETVNSANAAWRRLRN